MVSFLWDGIATVAGALAIVSLVLLVKTPGYKSAFGVALSLFLFSLYGASLEAVESGARDWGEVVWSAFLMAALTFAVIAVVAFLFRLGPKPPRPPA